MSKKVLDIIDKLGEKEQQITDLEFISPVFFSDTVVTSIDGLMYKFKIKDVKPGWPLHYHSPSMVKHKQQHTLKQLSLAVIHKQL